MTDNVLFKDKSARATGQGDIDVGDWNWMT